MPRCLIVASHFPPFQSAGVFRTIRIAKYLPEHDWQLQVLTLDPRSYLAGSSTAPQSLDQIPDKVRIHRTKAKHPIEWIQRAKGWLRQDKPQPKRKDAAAQSHAASERASQARSAVAPSVGRVQRVKDAITLPWMTPDRWIGWLPFATHAGKQILRDYEFDVLYSSGPPWTNHLVAERLKRAATTPWVADFRDPWVGNNFRPQRRGDTWTGRRHQALEQRVIKAADVVIFNTSRAREEAIERYPELSENKFLVIPNGFDPSDFAMLSPEATSCPATLAPSTDSAPDDGKNQPLRFVHSGAFYGKRNVDALLHALGDLIDQGRLGRSDVCVELIGAARPKRSRESEIIAERGIADVVKVLPPIPHDQCLKELAAANVLLLVQTDAPLCVPGKLYEYIAVGKPILTLAGGGSTADVVAEENLGPCIDPAESEQLKESLCDLVRQHQEGGLPKPCGSAVDRFNGRSQMKLFDAALHQAIDSQGKSSPPP
jgi:glycosyltransferase involved in cell wall biosynthesis